jgi:hypothetical protein
MLGAQEQVRREAAKLIEREVQPRIEEPILKARKTDRKNLETFMKSRVRFKRKRYALWSEPKGVNYA